MYLYDSLYHVSCKSFSPIPYSNFLVTFILSSANALNLDQSKISSFGKKLTLYQTTKF